MNNSLRTLAFVIASTIASGASANALDFFKVSSGAMALADEAALQSMFDDGYYTLETFDSLGTSPVTGSNDSLSWMNSSAAFSTAVGTFTLTTPGLDQAGDDVPDELKIESDATGEGGREVLSSSADDLWLDSNDASVVTWDIATSNTPFNALGFWLADPNDVDSLLKLTFSDGDTLTFSYPTFGEQSSGELFYVSLMTDSMITSASMIFTNCNDNTVTACEPLGVNDGWGIDDVKVGYAVPEPTTLALMGLGLLGFGAARRRKS